MTYIHTTPWALYNEIDEFAAAWLEQLIAAGHIANGFVDRRSIVDIQPYDLRGFRQVHLFAGIGVWSYSFHRAGISDDTEAWSASCPCQPFSSAGEGAGMDDERHLWPHAHHLIRERRPRFAFGEQVASKDGLAWLDLVQADMEGTGYAFGAVDTCAAGFGAPHIRQRQFWFAERLADTESVDSWSGLRGNDATRGRGPFLSYDRTDDELFGNCGVTQGDAKRAGLEGQRSGYSSQIGQRQGSVRSASETGEFSRLDNLFGDGRRTGRDNNAGDVRLISHTNDQLGGMANDDDDRLRSSPISGFHDTAHHVEPRGGDEWMADDARFGRREQRSDVGRGRSRSRSGTEELEQRPGGSSLRSHNRPTGPTNGFWSDVDWLHCRDERWRPVEPGTFPLAHGAPARVGRLRGYGNAINAEQATGFLEAFFEAKAIDLEPIGTDRFAHLDDLI